MSTRATTRRCRCGARTPPTTSSISHDRPAFVPSRATGHDRLIAMPSSSSTIVGEPDEVTDVVIVGGGPAGAATAIHLARRGYSVVILERHQEPRWRACGVFTSPLVRDRLADLELSRAEITKLARPISALELRSTRGARCTLRYERGFACGFDRVALDARLLELATAAGADTRRGCVVMNAGVAAARPQVTYSDRSSPDGRPRTIRTRLVVGGDGGGSRVARAAGVTSERNLLGRSAITFHVCDATSRAEETPALGRFVLGDHWYVGLAPVPGGRVNVGIVIPTTRLRAGVEGVVAEVLEAAETEGPVIDSVEVAGRLEHHVTRVGGAGWMLVGDACGFIDPLTGEGLHRSLVSAQLGADAAHRWLSGDRAAMADYDRRLRSRYRSKNVFSLVLQAFAANSHVLDYALNRLESREALRQTLTHVLSDQAPATRALDPRFIARLLAP